MKGFRLSETAALWITDLSDEYMGNIAVWVRKLHTGNQNHQIFGYQVLDDKILEAIEMEHNYVEKQAQ
eukprot:14482210-Heterocapsa_arctica.AAC.1